MRRMLSFLLLCGVLAAGATPAAARGGDEPEAEALALVEAQCAADGAPAEACACRLEAFRTQVLEPAGDSEVARLAALMHAADAAAPAQIQRAMGSAGGERMSAAMRLLFNFAPAAERCDDAAEAAARKREAAAAGAALPEGDDPRARFIRQCAADDGNAGICGCIADRMLEKMGPLEFELMVDMQAARGRGEDALASLAQERGMTVDEAREALAMMSGRIAGVMMSIDPMSCMESVE